MITYILFGIVIFAIVCYIFPPILEFLFDFVEFIVESFDSSDY